MTPKRCCRARGWLGVWRRTGKSPVGVGGWRRWRGISAVLSRLPSCEESGCPTRTSGIGCGPGKSSPSTGVSTGWPASCPPTNSRCWRRASPRAGSPRTGAPPGSSGSGVSTTRIGSRSRCGGGGRADSTVSSPIAVGYWRPRSSAGSRWRVPAQVLLGFADVRRGGPRGLVNDALVKRFTTLPAIGSVRPAAVGTGAGWGRPVAGVAGGAGQGGRADGELAGGSGRGVLAAAGVPATGAAVPGGEGGGWIWPGRSVWSTSRRTGGWRTSPSDRRGDAARDAGLGGIGFRIERILWLELNEDPDGLEARLWRCYEGIKAAA